MKNDGYLRPATEDDLDLLFEWANEKTVRSNSFTTELIAYGDHQEWFHRVMSDKNECIFIFCHEEKPVGQVRVTVRDDVAIVSYSIAVQYRLRGYGRKMLLLLEEQLKYVYPEVAKIRAEVKSDNVASIRVFEELNYCERCLVFEKKVENNSLIYKDVKICEGGVLFLTNNKNTLKTVKEIEKKDVNIEVFSEVVTREQLLYLKPKLIICYNYRYIIKREIIQYMRGRVINLHTSLLPWNRGANPNFWSFYDNTPKGVTIHIVDEHLDTGDILYQRECDFDCHEETFVTSYNRLQHEIQELLLAHWKDIFEWNVMPYKQPEQGTYHIKRDLDYLRHEVWFDWNENVFDVIQRLKSR